MRHEAGNHRLVIMTKCFECLSEDVAVKVIDEFGFENRLCAEDWAARQRFQEAFTEMMDDVIDRMQSSAAYEARRTRGNFDPVAVILLDPLPWRVRMRLWIDGRVNLLGCWLVEHGYLRAARILWRI